MERRNKEAVASTACLGRRAETWRAASQNSVTSYDNLSTAYCLRASTLDVTATHRWYEIDEYLLVAV